MTEAQQQRLDEIINSDYNFRFGEYISQGFSLVQKNLVGYISFTMLAFVALFIGTSLPIVGGLVVAILSPTLSVGFYIVAHKLDTRQFTEFGDFFKGFDDLNQLVLTYVVMTLILCLIASPIFYGLGNSGVYQWYQDLLEDPINVGIESMPDFPMWIFWFTIPVIYLSICYKWAYQFVVFYKMGFWDAMEYSRRIIAKQWLIIFIFSIVIGILAVLGGFLFLVGLLFTFPAMMCAEYAAFADVTGLILEDDGDISEHLVE